MRGVALLGALDEEGLLKWDETFLDGSFAPAKKGLCRRENQAGQGDKWMVLVDGQGLPLGVRLESASPHEVTLAEATLQEVSVPQPKGRPRQKPETGNCRHRLRFGSVAPAIEETRHRADRALPGEQPGTGATRMGVSCGATSGAGSSNEPTPGLASSARLLVRHEHLLSTYRAFFYIACFWITLRHCLWSREEAQ